MIAELRQLWQEAFGDSAQTVDAFFASGFSPDRCHYLCQDGVPISALYWFDCQLSGRKLAYIYAVATRASHRGQGFAHRLMDGAHKILQQKGYHGAILVPGAPELFAFYEKMGYRAVTCVDEFSCAPAGAPVALRQVDKAEYARLRNALLPVGGVTQEGAALDFLQTYAKFYAGDGFLLCATVDGEQLLAQELLGDASVAPRILAALGMQEGHFRTPGTGRDFAMFLPLTRDSPPPAYLGLALD